jgi:hypothetical protein
MPIPLQGIDLYSRNDNVMMASMELHAMLILKSVAKDLPLGWKCKSSMPQPPLGPDGNLMGWEFVVEDQAWWAKDSKGRRLFPLQETEEKYLIGSEVVPGGWEVSC